MNNKIIIVGKKSDSAELCMQLLKGREYQVELTTGIRNIEFKKKPALIIIDSICHAQLLNTDNHILLNDVPVIALTGNQPGIRTSLYLKGVVECISTPIIFHELLFRVKTIINYFQRGCIDQSYYRDDSLLKAEGSPEQALKINRSLLVQNTCHYLQKNINKKLTLDGVAMSMGVNRSKLAASFKQEIGLGVFEWLREQRLLKAQSLLVHSEMTIQQISFEVGYENCSNFSTTYKRQFNLTPRQQRKLTTQANVCLTRTKELNNEID